MVVLCKYRETRPSQRLRRVLADTGLRHLHGGKKDIQTNLSAGTQLGDAVQASRGSP
jgi:hypothetical protein